MERNRTVAEQRHYLAVLGCEELRSVLPVYLLGCLDLEAASQRVDQVLSICYAHRWVGVAEVQARFACFTFEEKTACAAFLRYVERNRRDLGFADDAATALGQAWDKY
ncbi:hypothetical protein EON82_02920 [bacterium]|nr:MAG: hypothetical protein EON82_02920 [bacterium]